MKDKSRRKKFKPRGGKFAKPQNIMKDKKMFKNLKNKLGQDIDDEIKRERRAGTEGKRAAGSE